MKRAFKEPRPKRPTRWLLATLDPPSGTIAPIGRHPRANGAWPSSMAVSAPSPTTTRLSFHGGRPALTEVHLETDVPGFACTWPLSGTRAWAIRSGGADFRPRRSAFEAHLPVAARRSPLICPPPGTGMLMSVQPLSG